MAAERLILRERGSETRRVFEAALAEEGLRGARVLEIDSREAVREAVAGGLGIGVVARAEFDLDGDGTVGGADIGLLLASWGTCSCGRASTRPAAWAGPKILPRQRFIWPVTRPDMSPGRPFM